MRLLIYVIALFLRDEEDMRKSQHLITQEVEAYMTLYEVKLFCTPVICGIAQCFIAE